MHEYGKKRSNYLQECQTIRLSEDDVLAWAWIEYIEWRGKSNPQSVKFVAVKWQKILAEKRVSVVILPDSESDAGA